MAVSGKAVSGARCGPIESYSCPERCLICGLTLRKGSYAYVVFLGKITGQPVTAEGIPTGAHEDCLTIAVRLARAEGQQHGAVGRVAARA